jgi:hypothetical protein
MPEDDISGIAMGTVPGTVRGVIRNVVREAVRISIGGAIPMGTSGAKWRQTG